MDMDCTDNVKLKEWTKVIAIWQVTVNLQAETLLEFLQTYTFSNLFRIFQLV